MGIDKKDDHFLKILLEETYHSLPARDVGRRKQDLFQYFNRRTEDFAEVSDSKKVLPCIQSIPLHYISKIGCYRLLLDRLAFDFPMRWSFFERVKDSVEGEVFLLSKDDPFGIFVLQYFKVANYRVGFVVTKESLSLSFFDLTEVEGFFQLTQIDEDPKVA